MAKEKGTSLLTVILYTVFALILSLSVFLMFTVSDDYNSQTAMSVVVGCAFWAGIAGVAVSAVLMSLKAKKLGDKPKFSIRRLGLISFFHNRLAMAADILLGLSVIGTVTVYFTGTNSVMLRLLFISLVIFSFSMHCMLNGNNYKIIVSHK